eukprot:9922131-Karenia_brevis.AAC.1
MESWGPGGDIDAIRLRPADRSLPIGIAPESVIDFRVFPTQAQLHAMFNEGSQVVAHERAALGLPA